MNSSPRLSLVNTVKQIPPPGVAQLYPGVLSLTGLAVAECYGLVDPGLIEQMADASSSLMVQIADAGQSLNARYPGLLPEHWLTSVRLLNTPPDIHRISEDFSGDGDAAMGAIAQILASAIATPSLDATWLGTLHEALLEHSSDPHPQSQERSAFHPIANGTISTAKRKRQGAYYTPAEIVDYMICQTLQPALDGQHPGDSSAACGLSILDPACGGGAFLLAAYRFLLRHWAAMRGRSPSREVRQSILQASIFGVDVDPQAVQVTRFALHLECLQEQGSLAPPFPGSPLDGTAKGLEVNVQCGNALIAEGTDGLVWEDAFPKVINRGGFDVVIGNPPYLDSERMTNWLPHWRHYCVKHYASAQGNWDLFCIFVEKAMTLCKPGGYHSFIVPNKLVSAPYATAVRSLLTTQGMLISIRDYSRSNAFAAAVYPLVYLVQRRSPSAHSPSACQEHPPDSLVRHDRMGHTLDQCQSTTWLSPRCFASPHAGWIVGDRPSQADRVLSLRQQLPLLGTLAQVHGAATVAEAYQLQAFIHEQLSLNPPALNQGQAEDRNTLYFQVINSGTIDRYRSLWATKRLRYLGESYCQPIISRNDLAQYFPRRFQQAIASKIIVAGMTKRLECVADLQGTLLAGKSTSIVMPHRLPLLYVLAILNSQPFHHIVIECLGSNSLQGGYLRIGPPQLKLLPIPLPRDDLGDRLVSYGKEMLHLGRLQNSVPASEQVKSIIPLIQNIEQNIDQIVSVLYGTTPIG